MYGDRTHSGRSGAARLSERIHDAARILLLLGGMTFGLIVTVGAGFILQTKLEREPMQSMKGLAPAMSSQFFGDMMHMEIPGFSAAEDQPYTFSESNVLRFLTLLLTGVDPRDPKSLIAGEMPGIRENIVQLRRSRSGGEAAAPADYGPVAPPGRTGGVDPGGRAETPAAVPEDFEEDAGENSAGGGAAPERAPEAEEAALAPGEAPEGGQAAAPEKEDGGAQRSTGDKKVVFIYHSHNRESWFPELKKQGKEVKFAEDGETNITLVGLRLAEKLEELGVGTLHSDTDYATAVKNYNWNFSYKYSQATVKTAMAENRDLVYFFDIHRDSQHRALTTAEIGGKSYAQVYFVIGLSNPHWEKNEAFANKIHEALERKYPGLSRGIWGKGENQGNGEYNQSLSPNSLVIEIGGPENTLEESYRTADALAEVIAEIYWEAERVNAGG